jgi:hypothetical protein
MPLSQYPGLTFEERFAPGLVHHPNRLDRGLKLTRETPSETMTTHIATTSLIIKMIYYRL